MKKQLLYLSLGLLAFKGNAQPVFQESLFAPVGLTALLSIGGVVAPGPGGANQTWDFSAESTTSVGLFSVVTPASTPCGGLFPTANYAWIAPGPTYLYFDRTATALTLLGENWPASCSGGITYSDYKQVLSFPFNYTNNSMDSWVSDAGSGNYSITYDGYGTLLTPFGSYSDVMRIAVIDGTNNYTQWVSTTSPSFVIMIASATNTKFFSDESLNLDELPVNQTISAFPNPSNGMITLSGVESASNLEIEVYNSLGERISTTVVDPNTKQVDFSELINGIYFYTIHSNDNFLSNGKIAIQK